MRPFRLFLLFLFVAALAACGQPGNKVTDEQVQKVISRDQLIGVYRSDCVPALFGTVSGSQYDEVVVTDDRAIKSRQAFSGSGCRQKYHVTSEIYSFAVGGKAAVGTELDLTVERVIHTPQAASLAAEYNKDKECERTDWRSGQALAVQGQNCLGETFLDLNARVFTQVNLNDDGTFQLGQSSEGSDVGVSGSTRHKGLSSEIYTRVK